MISHHIALVIIILLLHNDNEITRYCKMFLQIILSAQKLYAIKILCNKKASSLHGPKFIQVVLLPGKLAEC